MVERDAQMEAEFNASLATGAAGSLGRRRASRLLGAGSNSKGLLPLFLTDIYGVEEGLELAAALRPAVPTIPTRVDFDSSGLHWLFCGGRMSVSNIVRALSFSCVLLAAMSVPAWAQSSIAGVVTDESGAVLPGVTVEAASPALIEKVRAAITDAQGRYTIANLRPGVYGVTFSLTGSAR